MTSCPRRRAARSHCSAGARVAGMAHAAAGVICGAHGPCGPVTWAPAFAGVTFVGGAPGLPHLTSFPRRRAARSHCNAGARVAGISREGVHLAGPYQRHLGMCDDDATSAHEGAAAAVPSNHERRVAVRGVSRAGDVAAHGCSAIWIGCSGTSGRGRRVQEPVLLGALQIRSGGSCPAPSTSRADAGAGPVADHHPWPRGWPAHHGTRPNGRPAFARPAKMRDRKSPRCAPSGSAPHTAAHTCAIKGPASSEEACSGTDRTGGRL